MSARNTAVKIVRLISRLVGLMSLVIALVGALDGTPEGRHIAWVFGILGAFLVVWSFRIRKHGAAAPEITSIPARIIAVEEIDDPSTPEQKDFVRIQDLNFDVFLKYTDGEGQTTERKVTVEDMYAEESRDGTLEITQFSGYCHLRKQPRSFLPSRIVTLADPTTGEIIPDPCAYLVGKTDWGTARFSTHVPEYRTVSLGAARRVEPHNVVLAVLKRNGKQQRYRVRIDRIYLGGAAFEGQAVGFASRHTRTTRKLFETFPNYASQIIEFQATDGSPVRDIRAWLDACPDLGTPIGEPHH